MEEPDWSRGTQRNRNGDDTGNLAQRPNKMSRMLQDMSDTQLVDYFTPYLTTGSGKDALFEILTRTDVETVYRMCRVSKAMRGFCDGYQYIGVWRALFQRWATDEEFIKYTGYVEVVASFTRTAINWKWVVLTWQMMRRLEKNNNMLSQTPQLVPMTIPRRFRTSEIIDFIAFISLDPADWSPFVHVGLTGRWMPPEIAQHVLDLFRIWAPEYTEFTLHEISGPVKGLYRVVAFWADTQTYDARKETYVQLIYHLFVDGFGYGVLANIHDTPLTYNNIRRGEWDHDKSYGIRSTIGNPWHY